VVSRAARTLKLTAEVNYALLCNKRQTHECVEAAFLPTLRVLFNAPRSSPLASVNINNVVELMVSITRPSIIKEADLKGICQRNIQWVRMLASCTCCVIAVFIEELIFSDICYVTVWEAFNILSCIHARD